MPKKLSQSPLSFIPYFKSVIWGGERICKYKGIESNDPTIGESWEISAIPGHESIVSQGKYEGWNLLDLIKAYGADFIGKEVYERYEGSFPLLVKLIDANDNLSVQVHPDDKLAMERHNCLGKTELWYIIKADQGAKIYSGLNKKISPEEYEELVRNDSFASVLAEHDSASGDVFFLPSGRVHAIGAGNLLAEIQESSDITYRIYDYGRKDKDGKQRELHTQLAKDAIDFSFHTDYKSPRISDSEKIVELANCRHFKTSRILLEGSMILNLDNSSFTILMCLEGDMTLKYPDGETYLKEGNTILIPACLSQIELKGKAKILMTRS